MIGACVVIRRALLVSAAIALLLSAAGRARCQAETPAVLDRVVAVVNNRAILASDIADEIRISILDPNISNTDKLTPRRALQQLISRALIQQQIRQEDAQSSEPSNEEVQARLMELRKELPACVPQNCASDAGWAVFLATNGLTPDRVERYMRLRLEILRFIEDRFRQGIRISQQDIETYYRQTLIPQYAKGNAIPALEKVSPRIEEILLQQQVNALFGAWLDNLRKQGDVEVLDPELETNALEMHAPSTAGGSGA